MLVSIERPYATSFQLITLSYIYLSPFSSYREVLIKLPHLIKGCLSLVHWFSVTSANIAISRIVIKLPVDSLRYILFQTVWVYIFNYFDVIGSNATEFGRITQNNGHYTLQGHSRTTILVPIQSPYTTSH